MREPADWIKRHQVVAFFVLTFAITWGLGFSYDAVLRRGQFLLVPLFFLATCGPALSGIILTALGNTEPWQGARRRFWIAFLVAWVVSVLVYLAHNTFWNHAPFSFGRLRLVLVSVVPVAFVIAMAFSRIPAVRRYLASLVRLRGVWGWSGLALVLMPVLVLLSVVAGSALGRRPLAAYHLPSTGLSLLGLIVVKLLYQLFFFNATGEEVGWRGFALPRLQSRTSPLIAALIIALFWAPWHFFLWRAVGQPVTAWQFWGQQYVVHILASFLIVWIYNRARGSILVAGVTHAAANTALALFPGVDFATLSIVLAIAAAALIAADRMWAKLPRGHPAVFTPGESTAGRGAESAPAAAT